MGFSLPAIIHDTVICLFGCVGIHSLVSILVPRRNTPGKPGKCANNVVRMLKNLI